MLNKESMRETAEAIIQKLNMRKMDGYYADTKEEALALVREKFLTKGVSVAWGGSMTLAETGVMDYLKESECVIYDRADAKTPEEEKIMKGNIVNADYFLMSTNAITKDGELVNIDGRANRVSFLCYGPEHVLILAGMNKVVETVEEGVDRTRNVASPKNAVRLHKNTPCAVQGKCGDCLSPDCICSQIVVTRHSTIPNRIHVILIGEELGY